ncbi:protein of unknown function [Burkholderia multivorans]
MTAPRRNDTLFDMQTLKPIAIAINHPVNAIHGESPGEPVR